MKKLVAWAVIATLSMSMIGCSSSDSSSSSSNTSSSTSTADTTTTEPTGDKPYDGLTISYLASQDWVYEAELELAEQFKEETGITVDYQIIDASQYSNMLMTKLNAGDGVDIFASQSGAVDIVTSLNITENGLDLSNESWASNLEDLAAQEASVDGVLYGQPIFDITTTWVIAYNKAIFEELGLNIPSTYDEFTGVCDTILASGVIPIYECVSDGWHHVLWFPELCVQVEELASGTADALNNNTATFAGNETMTTILSQIKDMVDKGYWGNNYMANTYADTARYFAAGDYAMTVANQGFPAEVAEADESFDTSNIGYFVMPLADNQTIGINAACPTRFIASSSQNVDAAKLYLEFLASDDSLAYLTENTARFNHLPYSNAISTFDDATDEFFTTFGGSQGAVYQTVVKYVNPQWMEMGTDITALILGQITEDEVLQNIDKLRAQQAADAGDSSW